MTRRRKTLHHKKKRKYAPPSKEQLKREVVPQLVNRTMEATINALMRSNPGAATRFINGTLLRIEKEDPQAVELVQRSFHLRLAAHPLFKELTLEQVETVAHLLNEWEGTVGDLINVAKNL
jgi:hypothetical protein